MTKKAAAIADPNASCFASCLMSSLSFVSIFEVFRGLSNESGGRVPAMEQNTHQYYYFRNCWVAQPTAKQKNLKVPFSGSHRGWIRTIDPQIKNLLLCQLSYTMKYTSACPRHPDRIAALVADVKDKKFVSNLAIGNDGKTTRASFGMGHGLLVCHTYPRFVVDILYCTNMSMISRNI